MKENSLAVYLLALIPFVAVCFTVPLWDRVYPLVFGFPFNFFWLVCWIPLTSLCLWGAYMLRQTVMEKRQSAKGRPE